jgi:sarcosine oxidase
MTMGSIRPGAPLERHEVVVVGLGVLGAASLWQLTRSGVRAVGLEAGGPMHSGGSSHGATRIYRRAYFEGEAYLPWLELAHRGWDELESTSGKALRTPTGGVFIGPAGSALVSGSLATARSGSIAHERWSTSELNARLPQFAAGDDVEAVFEPGAYALAADDARLHMLSESVRGGAELRYGTAVRALQGSNDGVRVTLASGAMLQAEKVVVATGPWLARQLIPELAGHLTPMRVPVFWFAPKAEAKADFDWQRLPVFIYECSDGALLYGLPMGLGSDPGVKVAFHNRQQTPADPDSPRPPLDAALSAEISRYATRILPALEPTPVHSKWCFYTMTSDEAFVIGASQRMPNVFYASACSGHGFKFAPALGGALASLARGEPPAVELEAFALERFTAG